MGRLSVRNFLKIGRSTVLLFVWFVTPLLSPCCAAATTNPELGVDVLLQQQQQRDRVLREQQAPSVDVRLPSHTDADSSRRIPLHEQPCFPIHQIVLDGDMAEQFRWALAAASLPDDPAKDRCLGSMGANLVMRRVQNAIMAHGYITTRVVAGQQDLRTGVLRLTLVPGRVRAIRFASGSDSQTNLLNAIPARPGDLLNLRDIEQGLENLKRVPSAEADIQIAPADDRAAHPGDSDLVISWHQSKSVRMTLSTDDSGSKATGKYLGSVTLSLDNWARLNDLFYISYNHDMGGGGVPGERGAHGYTWHYSLPLKNWTLGYTASSYEYRQAVAGINQTYVYSGTSQNDELKLSRRLYRDAASKRTAYISSWTNASRHAIDDTEVEVQRRRMAGWGIGLTDQEYLGAGSIYMELSYRHGTGANNAIAAPEEESGEGTSRMRVANAQLQLSAPFQLGRQALRFDSNWRAQLNRSPLVPQDRFAIGGRYTVRGYDGESVLSAERGWLVRNDISLALGGSGQALYLGLDYGEVDGYSSQFLPGRHLAGAVIGLRGAFRGVSYDLFGGQPISHPSNFRAARAIAGYNLTWTF